MTEPSIPTPAATPSDQSEPTVTWDPRPGARMAGATTGAPPLARPLPGSLLAAAVLLLVGAGLAALVAVLMLLGGAMLAQMPTNFGNTGLTEEELRASLAIAGAAVIIFGGLGLLVGLAHLLAGIGVLRRRGWGRILGLVVSALGCIFFALGLVLALVARAQPISQSYLDNNGLTVAEYQRIAGWTQGIGIGITFIGLAIYVFIVVVLARKGAEFA